MYDFQVYSLGLCFASVCSDLSPKEVVKEMNRTHPTGIFAEWMMSTDQTFKSGEPNPCPCKDYPDTHKHYLLEC